MDLKRFSAFINYIFLQGSPGNPLDSADEGVFCVRINPGGAAARDNRIKVGSLV